MTGPPIATFTKGNGPLIATAIHAGGHMRRSLLQFCQLDRLQRLREEDPCTDKIAQVAPSRIVGERSRFEVDLNRPPQKAIYLKPEDAWGLNVYKDLPWNERDASMALYDSFYHELRAMMDEALRRHERVVIFDVHSYNHQRQGPGIDDDPEKNPEVNIGTGNIDRKAWAPVVDGMMQELRRPMRNGRVLDVRENIKFKGGYFGKWLYDNYGSRVCPISIEFKKIFMDEWTGEPDLTMIEDLRAHLELAAQRTIEILHATTPAERE
jgi:N-formylglutamate amidohydrolase